MTRKRKNIKNQIFLSKTYVLLLIAWFTAQKHGIAGVARTAVLPSLGRSLAKFP